MKTSHKRKPRGISTIEVMVGAALSMMAVLAMYSVFRVQTTAFAAHNAYAESQTVTRTVIDLMTRELRMAAYDPSGLAIPATVGSCPGVKAGIVAATGSSITFRQDLNGDGLLTGANELVTYVRLGTQLRRQDGAGAPLVLVDGIPTTGFSLQYYDGSNPPNQLAAGGGALTQNQLNCVQKVRVTLRAEIATRHMTQPMRSMAESEVAIRNLSLTNF